MVGTNLVKKVAPRNHLFTIFCLDISFLRLLFCSLSRPGASAPLHNLPTVDRLVEVVGFNEENVKQYIESEFEKCPEKASSLIEQLENNPVIESVCSVPLNCAIICNLWHTLDKDLPRTLTELYVQIVLNIILRNLKKRNYNDGLISLSFDSIPGDLHDMFWLMCQFAYECLTRDQIVFSQEELSSLIPSVQDFSEKLLCFGLFTVCTITSTCWSGLVFSLCSPDHPGVLGCPPSCYSTQ